jgi:hypothetical protein
MRRTTLARLLNSFVSSLALFLAADAWAVCGDVNGDGQKSATDALAVLRSAVGDPVELVCAGEGPSDLRFYNDFSCGSGSSVSEARFNGFTFSADAGQTTVYQSVELAAIDTIEIDLCGGTYYFEGPISLPPGRAMTFYMAILDPEVYQFPGVDVPAMFVLYDDGAPAGSLDAGSSPAQSNRAGVLYGGRLRE